MASLRIDANIANLTAAITAFGDECAADMAAATAKVSAQAAKVAVRAGQADSSRVTRRIANFGSVRLQRGAGGGGRYQAVAGFSIGGGASRLSGGASAGDVVFGSEFGGQSRTYIRGQGRRRRQLRAKPKFGLSVTRQRAALQAAGVRTRQTTLQFRPYRRSGYWLFTSLADRHNELAQAWVDAADGVLRKWATARG